MIDELVEKYNLDTIKSTITPNFIKIPVNRFDMNIEGAELFNEFYKEVVNDKRLHKLVRTKSGGISIDARKLRLPAYDVVVKRTAKGRLSGIEITLILKTMCRIQFCGKPKDVIGGTIAFREFKKIFKKYGINLEEYAVTKEKGLELKEEIEPPLIKLRQRIFEGMVFENAHHLDYHSSYPTGLINTHPEFKAPLTYMYEHRKKTIGGYKDFYKGVMNSSIGYMQSEYSGFKYTNLARDAINDNNKRIRELSQKLSDSGRTVILYNTDGIWYAGDIYHDENEGETLCTWQNDHINCKFRAKSDGAYEYIEDNKYYPVVRGSTKLDRLKSRDEWEWGDIFKEDAEAIMFSFDEKEGIKYE